MTREQKRTAARRKILHILPRSELEHLAGIERPWMASVADLVGRAVIRWDADGVEAAVRAVLVRAKGDES